MRESDLPAFAAMLDDVYALLRPGQPLSATARAMFFRALAGHELGAVRTALDAHVRDPQRGRFAPVPADILAHLLEAEADDGRPGHDEAWAIAVRGTDEAATIVWTEEIAEAWGAARPVMAMGDEVGARMAFREVYDRLVAAARASRKPVRWSASLGHDPEGRERALAEAARLGRSIDDPIGTALPAPRADALLPAPEGAGRHAPNAEIRARLLALRDRITGHAAESQDPGAAERERLAQLKAAAAQAVEHHQRQQSDGDARELAA
jgi:hypothetical protein